MPNLWQNSQNSHLSKFSHRILTVSGQLHQPLEGVDALVTWANSKLDRVVVPLCIPPWTSVFPSSLYLTHHKLVGKKSGVQPGNSSSLKKESQLTQLALFWLQQYGLIAWPLRVHNERSSSPYTPTSSLCISYYRPKSLQGYMPAQHQDTQSCLYPNS